MFSALAKSVNNIFRLYLVLMFAVMLSACVTTQTGGAGDKADAKKARETSLQLAMTYISRGNWAQAKHHLQYVESVDKNNPQTFEALALVFQNTGELETAERYYKKSVKLAPESMRTRNNYATFLYERGRFDEAAAQLEVVAGDLLYENRVEAFINLGRCYLKLGQLPKAEAAFRRSYLMEREEPAVLMSLAEVYFLMERYAESQRYFDAFTKNSKKRSAGALWLGIRLAEKFGDSDTQASYVLALKNLYPKSEEYLLYRQSQGTSSAAGK